MKCHFCKEYVDPEDDETYREVTSWVHGPKRDGGILREQTGRMAHAECVHKIRVGVAPETEPLF